MYNRVKAFHWLKGKWNAKASKWIGNVRGQINVNWREKIANRSVSISMEIYRLEKARK